MTLAEALAQIRDLTNLHEARRRALIAAAVDLRDQPDELRRHAYRCRAEDQEAADRGDEWYQEMSVAVQIRNAQPPRKRETPAYALKKPLAPPERPVTVTWGPARKAGQTRVIRRPERIQNTKSISEPVELPPRSKHGTEHAYNKFRCRCNECREAKKRGQIVTNFEHGTRRGYLQGRCRCDDCRLANDEAAKAYRNSKKKK